MASLHKRPNSPFWWGKFRDETGAIRYRTTKKTKHSEAHEVVFGWQRSAEAATRGELTKAVVLKTLNEILERTTGERLDISSTGQFFSDWLRGKIRTGKSDGTTARYRPILEGFKKFLGEKRCAVSIAGITATDIEAFRDSEVTSGKSASSTNLTIRVIRAALNDARRKGLIPANPADAVDLIDAAAHERLPFSDRQIASLLNVADTEWTGMILLGGHAGFRIGDAAKLRWSAIDLKDGTLTFTAQKTTRRNHGKPQTIAMHPELNKYMKSRAERKNADGPLFPTLHDRAAGGNQGLSNSFSALMTRAQIERPIPNERVGKGRSFNVFSFHSLRHTFISRLANANVAADVRKEIAGHSSDEVHRRYTHLDLTAQRQALTQITGFTTSN